MYLFRHSEREEPLFRTYLGELLSWDEFISLSRGLLARFRKRLLNSVNPLKGTRYTLLIVPSTISVCTFRRSFEAELLELLLRDPRTFELLNFKRVNICTYVFKYLCTYVHMCHVIMQNKISYRCQNELTYSHVSKRFSYE